MSEKLLIVDKDPDMAMLLSMLIKEITPYKTEATNNPLEALELVKQNGFALIITEMKMPVLDGIELLDAVKRIDEDIPVIIISENGGVEYALEAMNKGAFDYIAKPFRKEQMLYAIDNALKLRRFKRENRILRKKLEELTFAEKDLAHQH